METDLDVLIPDTYVANTSERLQLNAKLDSVKDEAALQKLVTGIQDRFGPLPAEIEHLVQIARLRWLALSLGFEKLTLKKETLRDYIPTENNERYIQGQMFGNILKYVQAQPRRSRLRELKGKLNVIVEQVVTLKDAREVLEGLKVV